MFNGRIAAMSKNFIFRDILDSHLPIDMGKRRLNVGFPEPTNVQNSW